VKSESKHKAKLKRDFDQLMCDVKRLHEKLVSMPPVTHDKLGVCNYSGVYLFTENGVHLYVGRTKRPLKTRLKEYARPSSRLENSIFRRRRGDETQTFRASVGKVRVSSPRLLLFQEAASAKAAPFAFRLARIVTGMTEVTYKAGNGRRELLNGDVFQAALLEQKLRIAAMEIRYVHIEDATTQALLEIYTSTVLETPHNEFTTS
jgi:hypothetical protein